MNFSLKGPTARRRRLRIALPALLVLAAAACASTPPPATNLQAAQLAIANAERVDAASLAAVELGEARAKLADAERAVAAKNMVAASQFADEARANAELAAAKTGAEKAKAVNADIAKATSALEEEMQRKSGESK